MIWASFIAVRTRSILIRFLPHRGIIRTEFRLDSLPYSSSPHFPLYPLLTVDPGAENCL